MGTHTSFVTVFAPVVVVCVVFNGQDYGQEYILKGIPQSYCNSWCVSHALVMPQWFKSYLPSRVVKPANAVAVCVCS